MWRTTKVRSDMSKREYFYETGTTYSLATMRLSEFICSLCNLRRCSCRSFMAAQ